MRRSTANKDWASLVCARPHCKCARARGARTVTETGDGARTMTAGLGAKASAPSAMATSARMIAEMRGMVRDR